MSSTDSLHTLSSYGSSAAHEDGRCCPEGEKCYLCQFYADTDAGVPVEETLICSDQSISLHSLDSDATECSGSTTDSEEDDTYIGRRLLEGGRRRVHFNMHNISVHETHAPDEYERLADFNPELSRLQWEEEEEDEWLRQLDFRWTVFERSLPPDEKCHERTEFERARALVMGEPTAEKWAKIEAMQEEALRAKRIADLEEQQRRKREEEAKKIVQRKIEMRKAGIKSPTTTSKTLPVRPVSLSSIPVKPALAMTRQMSLPNLKEEGRSTPPPGGLTRSLSSERLLGKPLSRPTAPVQTERARSALHRATSLDMEMLSFSFEDFEEKPEDILFPNGRPPVDSGRESFSDADSDIKSVASQASQASQVSQTSSQEQSASQPPFLDSGVNSTNPSCESLEVPESAAKSIVAGLAQSSAASTVSQLPMDQLQLLAKLIALEMRKTGFPVPENTAPAGSPESPAKTISANDGLSSPRSPLSPLSPGPPPSSPRAPLPGSPKMKKKVVKAKKSKSSSTGSKTKTKRRPKSRSPEYYYRAELEVKTDQQHQEIREQVEERKKRLLEAKRAKAAKAKQEALSHAKKSVALKHKESRIMSAEERRVMAVQEKKRALKEARLAKEAQLQAKRKAQAKEEKKREKQMRRKLNEKYKKMETRRKSSIVDGIVDVEV